MTRPVAGGWSPLPSPPSSSPRRGRNSRGSRPRCSPRTDRDTSGTAPPPSRQSGCRGDSSSSSPTVAGGSRRATSRTSALPPAPRRSADRSRRPPLPSRGTSGQSACPRKSAHRPGPRISFRTRSGPPRRRCCRGTSRGWVGRPATSRRAWCARRSTGTGTRHRGRFSASTPGAVRNPRGRSPRGPCGPGVQDSPGSPVDTHPAPATSPRGAGLSPGGGNRHRSSAPPRQSGGAAGRGWSRAG